MALSTENLIRLITTVSDRLAEATEAQKENEGLLPMFVFDRRGAESIFAAAQELLAFRRDYPEVVYEPFIADEYGVRGVQ